jgi:hypothetical protein
MGMAGGELEEEVEGVLPIVGFVVVLADDADGFLLSGSSSSSS